VLFILGTFPGLGSSGGDVEQQEHHALFTRGESVEQLGSGKEEMWKRQNYNMHTDTKEIKCRDISRCFQLKRLVTWNMLLYNLVPQKYYGIFVPVTCRTEFVNHYLLST